MYAVITTVGIEDPEHARKTLHENVIPMVRQQPGFVSGVWLEPENGEGEAIVVFSSEDAAREVANMITAGPPAPVVIRKVEVRAVAGRA
jgi:hypothetical protein